MATAEARRAALGLLLAACGAVAPVPPAQEAPPDPAPPHAGRLRGHDLVEPPPGDLREECARRRAALAARLPGPCVVWLDGAPEDELQRFVQSPDVWWLTGCEVPGLSLALRIDEEGRLVDEVLLLPEHDPLWESWNGPRLHPGREAELATGLRSTRALAEGPALLAAWAPARVLASAPPAVALPPASTLDTTSLPRHLAALRLVKSAHELACLRAAVDVTCAALREALAEVRPGAFEFEVQGVLEGAFLRLGAQGPGFASILGSGPHALTLHYVANRRAMQAGELLLLDVGARWSYYCADVTRTVPVDGRFSPRQRQVYEAVLAAQQAAERAARPGVTMAELDAVARRVLEEQGFVPARRWFRHGLGHWIGLEVHDVGGPVPLQPGMTFTLEPGLYLDDEGLGVRIEDDYLMTEAGAVKLSGGVPSDPDDIEALLAGSVRR